MNRESGTQILTHSHRSDQISEPNTFQSSPSAQTRFQTVNHLYHHHYHHHRHHNDNDHQVCEKTKSKPRKIFDAVHKLWKTDAEVKTNPISGQVLYQPSLGGEDSFGEEKLWEEEEVIIERRGELQAVRLLWTQVLWKRLWKACRVVQVRANYGCLIRKRKCKNLTLIIITLILITIILTRSSSSWSWSSSSWSWSSSSWSWSSSSWWVHHIEQFSQSGVLNIVDPLPFYMVITNNKLASLKATPVRNSAHSLTDWQGWGVELLA